MTTAVVVLTGALAVLVIDAVLLVLVHHEHRTIAAVRRDLWRRRSDLDAAEARLEAAHADLQQLVQAAADAAADEAQRMQEMLADGIAPGCLPLADDDEQRSVGT